MGKDSPAKLQYPQASNLNVSEIDDKFQIQNNPSDKETDCQSIIDLCKDNSRIGSKEDKDNRKLLDEWKVCKGHFIQGNSQQCSSDETKRSLQDANEDKNQKTVLHDATYHSLLDNRDLDSDNSSDCKGEPVKHGFMHFCNSRHKDYYYWAPEQTEKIGNKIEVRAFQKQDYLREFTKYVNSFLDKCSWYEKAEQETIDETVSLNEDDDTTTEELSTSDISSEGLEEVVNKSYDSDCSDIGIVQTSEGSVNEANKDGFTNDECNSQADEDCEDDVFPALYIDGQQPQFADDPVMNVVVENNWAIQQAELESEEQTDDGIIDIVEETTCDEGAADDELSGTYSADGVAPKSKLVMPSFYYTPSVATPVDVTAKHLVLSNNGYMAAGDTEGTMQVIVYNMDLQIPPPQDNVNPLLPVQPRSLDDPQAHQLPSSAGHLNVQGMDCSDGSDDIKQVKDVPSHEQPLSAGCLNIQGMNWTNGSDSVEQAEDELLFNSQVSLIVDPPQVMEDPLVYSFSASSEGTLDISDFPETGSEDSEESDCWLPSTSESFNDQESERLEFT